MKSAIRARAFILILVVCLSLSCNFANRMAQPTPTVTSAPTETPLVTKTPVPTPTETPVPTATFTPAPTVVQPTAGPTATTVVEASVPRQFVVNQMLRYSGGVNKVDVSGSVVKDTYDRYVVSMAAGESLNISVSSPQQTAGFMVVGPNQQAMRGSESGDARWWSSGITDAGDYAIVIGSELGRASYTLSVNITLGGAAAGGPYQALSTAKCKEIEGQAQSALGVNFSNNVGGFSFSGLSGKACVIAANGNGNKFKSVDAVIDALDAAFAGEWSEKSSLTADGATGAVRGYQNDDGILIVSVQWQPAPEAECPAGQPISACEVKPKYKLYTISIYAATNK